MFIYLGIGLSPEFTQAVFGAPSTQQVDTERIGLPVFDNPMSKRVRGIVESIQKERTRCMRVKKSTSKEFHRNFNFFPFKDRAGASTRQAGSGFASLLDRGSRIERLGKLRGLPLLHAQGDPLASKLERSPGRNKKLQTFG